MRRALPALAVLAACATLAPACGSGGGDAENPEPRRGTPAGNVDPAPAESVDDVIDRVRGAATAGGCEAVRGLLHSTYGDVSNAACAAVKAQIDGFRDPRGAAYRSGAAIDYRTFAGRHRTLVLALDADRTYRLAFIRDTPGRSIGSAKPASVDGAARRVVAAMQSGDCAAFLRLVSRAQGLGVGPDREVCRRVSSTPFRVELVADRTAVPGALGGNGRVAFYRLRPGQRAYYTMVMVRERTAGGREDWVLVNALPAQ